MDPITHGLIGMAVSAVGQDTFSIMSPITAAAVIGSIIPDGDIILRVKGSSFYLKHHRGVSHSLPGITFEAVAVGLMLKLICRETPLVYLLLWAFIGALSHIFMDILNSYGARIFWPFSNKKKSLSLLTITDPVVIVFAILSIMSTYKEWGYNGYIMLCSLLYLISKIAMHLYGHALLKKKFSGSYNIEKVHLLPSMIAVHKFHYIIQAPIHKIVGEIDFLFNKVGVFNVFDRLDKATRKNMLDSKTANYFRDFTPIFHVGFERVSSGYKVLLTDLRYILRGKFLHHASIVYNDKMIIIEEKFHPYSIKNRLDV